MARLLLHLFKFPSSSVFDLHNNCEECRNNKHTDQRENYGSVFEESSSFN
jgi:hypothetical protein